MNKLIDNTSTYHQSAYGQSITRISADSDGNVSVEEIDPRDIYLDPVPEDLWAFLCRELIYWPCAAIVLGFAVYFVGKFLFCVGCT